MNSLSNLSMFVYVLIRPSHKVFEKVCYMYIFMKIKKLKNLLIFIFFFKKKQGLNTAEILAKNINNCNKCKKTVSLKKIHTFF